MQNTERCLTGQCFPETGRYGVLHHRTHNRCCKCFSPSTFWRDPPNIGITLKPVTLLSWAKAAASVLCLVACLCSASCDRLNQTFGKKKSKLGESCARSADCIGSLRCIEEACRNLSQEAVDANNRKCRRSSDCALSGRCSSSAEGECVAKSATDCVRSHDCKNHGTCHAAGGECIAKTAEDCKGAASRCKYNNKYDSENMCTPRNGECLLSNRDCRRTLNCREMGACTARMDGYKCIANSDADCRKSSGCRKAGLCKAKGKFSCEAGANQDCRKSIECKKKGACIWMGGLPFIKEMQNKSKEEGLSICVSKVHARMLKKMWDDYKKKAHRRLSGNSQKFAGRLVGANSTVCVAGICELENACPGRRHTAETLLTARQTDFVSTKMARITV